MKQTYMNIRINRDGEPDPDYIPSTLDKVQEAATEAFSQAWNAIKVQVRMAAYDALHGTKYRKAYNKLNRQERNRRFLASLGLETA